MQGCGTLRGMSDIAQRAERNPDILQSGCSVTGKIEPGVVLPTVAPEEGSVLYLGESVIYEIAAALKGITVQQAKYRLEDRPSPKQAQLDAAQAEIKRLKTAIDRWEALRERMAESGMIVTTFDEA